MSRGDSYGEARILRGVIFVGNADFCQTESALLTYHFIFAQRRNYILTADEKRAVVIRVSEILEEFVSEEPKIPDKPTVPEMLTIKECAKTIKGVTEHAVRRLVAKGEIPCIRVGDGKYGKILISKWDFIGYFQNEKSQKTPPLKSSNLY